MKCIKGNTLKRHLNLKVLNHTLVTRERLSIFIKKGLYVPAAWQRSVGVVLCERLKRRWLYATLQNFISY